MKRFWNPLLGFATRSRVIYISLVCASCIVVTTPKAIAWGQEGHSIIAEVAQRRLEKPASDAIANILATKAGTSSFSLPSLASFGSWADDARYTETYRKSAPWHFVNAPINSEIDMARDCVEPDGCIISKLEKLKTELRCGDDQSKIVALKFAVHFVGDIHQPFHTVSENTGENGLHVRMLIPGKICENRTCLIRDEWQNLHEVWDSTIINKTFFAWGSYVEHLESDWLTKIDPIKESAGTPLDWAKETHSLAKDFVVFEGATLDQYYYKKAQPVVDRQLGRAGLRLARFLNDAYSSAICPAQ